MKNDYHFLASDVLSVDFNKPENGDETITLSDGRVFVRKPGQLPKQIHTIRDYESIKCDKLIKYGFPQKELWLTECHETKLLSCYYGYEMVFDLGITDPFVIYYHESGNIGYIAGFHDDESFDAACKHVASYFN